LLLDDFIDVLDDGARFGVNLREMQSMHEDHLLSLRSIVDRNLCIPGRKYSRGVGNPYIQARRRIQRNMP
jgi:hypothetical protein